MTKKPKKCPYCGGRGIISILYGMPTFEAAEKAKEGRIRLGGCCVPIDGPYWYCKTCDKEVAHNAYLGINFEGSE